MMRLRSLQKSSHLGFCYHDPASGWRYHSWSFRQTAAAWREQCKKRGRSITHENAEAEVEEYLCRELMKEKDWDRWVIFSQPPTPPPIIHVPTESNISVVIPIYRPDTNRLNSCIESVLTQVNEVIMVYDSGVSMPSDLITHKKIRGFRQDTPDSGFGHKCNLGAKQATSEYIWLLNDDCQARSGCARALLEALNSSPQVGMVGHLLKYPNGTIQHEGTERATPNVGFKHRSVGNTETTIKSPVECENVTGASILVRKQAFNAVGGFSPEYFLYLEDADLCLKMRQAGWKIVYTPYAEGIHEEHASSRERPEIDQILKASAQTFQSKWGEYMSRPPPEFASIQPRKASTIDICYVHLVGDATHEENARKFVDSAVRHPPGDNVNWVIILNSQNNRELPQSMLSTFLKLGEVGYFRHDDSGWDIGGYQAYCKQSKASLAVFLGGSSYCRRSGWIIPFVDAFNRYGENAIYGSCGNLGDLRVNVHPHIRTTGFACSPSVLNRYPSIVTKPQDRYPFEHGPNSLTMWAWSQGLQVLVVNADKTYGYPSWNDGVNSYQRGNQSDLLLGDRLTAPPFFHCA